MDRMSDPDAMEEFSDRFRSDLDYGSCTVVARTYRRQWGTTLRDRRYFEVQCVRRVSATSVLYSRDWTDRCLPYVGSSSPGSQVCLSTCSGADLAVADALREQSACGR